jgi:hypothetical protein
MDAKIDMDIGFSHKLGKGLPTIRSVDYLLAIKILYVAGKTFKNPT